MPWITVREEYESVPLYAEKSVPCAICGKKLKRSKTFTQTLNPFNKRDGRPKTRVEIIEELRQNAAAWKLESETCKTCKTC